MDAYGYTYKGTASSTPADYVPSLVGTSLRDDGEDVYFERVAISDRTITALEITRWTVFDNGPAFGTDPILRAKGPVGTYYIPKSELEEIAAAHQDDDIWTMIKHVTAGWQRFRS